MSDNVIEVDGLNLNLLNVNKVTIQEYKNLLESFKFLQLINELTQVSTNCRSHYY